jgi:hypothetical protein
MTMDATTRLAMMQLLTTALLPAGAALAVALGGLKLAPREGDRPLLTGLAAGAGLLVAFLGIRGLPPVPPVDTLDWIPFLLAAAWLVGLGGDALRARVSPWAVLETWAWVAAAGFVLVMRPLFEGSLEGIAAPLHVLGAVVVARLAFGLTSRAALKVSPHATFAALALTSASSAGVVVLTNSALLGQLLGGVTTVTAALAVASWLRPALRPGFGAIGAVLAVSQGLLLYALHYIETPTAAIVALALAPAGAWLAALSQHRWKALGLALLAAALPLGAAFWFATHPPGEEAEEPPAGSPDAPADPYQMYNPYK